jgi:uncharacterized membrane protein/predicted DsbA family dithiol-disulfide isomerase
MPAAQRVPRRPRSAPISTTYRWVLIALALLGGGVSLYLTYVSERLFGDAEFKSVCAINAFFDCDRAVSSGFGSVGGIPLAWFGAWFYVLAGFLAVRLKGDLWPALRVQALLLLLLSALAVGLSVVLAAISLLLLQVVCLLCVTLYLVNIALFAVSWMTFRAHGETLIGALDAERRSRSWRRRFASTVLLLAALALVPAITSRLVWGRSRFCDLVDQVHRGGAHAIRVTVYSDVQCPHCRVVDRLLRSTREAPGVQIIARHYPLDPVCNPRVKGRGHPGACLQARALICAREQAGYHQLSDRLFDEGAADEATLRRLAVMVGLAEPQFAACLTSPESERELKADMSAAVSAGIHGTPSILFETGDLYVGRLEPEDISCLTAAGARVAATPSPR